MEFNNSSIRCLYPSFNSLALAIHNLRNDISDALISLFEIQPQEMILLRSAGLSRDEFLVRRFLSRKLLVEIVMQILAFLVPDIVHRILGQLRLA
jgi:hypothetical protein